MTGKAVLLPGANVSREVVLYISETKKRFTFVAGAGARRDVVQVNDAEGTLRLLAAGLGFDVVKRMTDAEFDAAADAASTNPIQRDALPTAEAGS